MRKWIKWFQSELIHEEEGKTGRDVGSSRREMGLNVARSVIALNLPH